MGRSLASLPESIRRAVLRQHPELAHGGTPKALPVPVVAPKAPPVAPKPSGKRRGELNATEGRYAAQLDALGLRYTYEGITLHRAGLRYTPDFVVEGAPRLELVEVKPAKKDGKALWLGSSRARYTAAKTTWGHLFTFRVVVCWRGQWEDRE